MSEPRTLIDNQTRLDLLREALPYIQRFQGQTFVVKLSGKVTEDRDNLASLAEELGIGAFFLPVFQRGKRAHADRDAISFKHAHELRDVFGLIAVHHRAFAVFECPACAAGFEHDRVSAQLVDPDLHRCASAETRVKEHESHGFAAQRFGLIVARLEAQGRVNQSI